jgi:release factor glutamine methyltransferase
MPTLSRRRSTEVVGSSTSRPRPEPDPTIYPPREDTFLLLPFADVRPGSTFLEVGTGAGLIALAAARRGARVVATDRNPDGLRRLARVAREERLILHAVRTDLAHGLGPFDRVVFNPPYLPTRPGERDPDPWHNLALDGGPDGCRVMARWVAELPSHLEAGGSAFVLTSTLQSARRLRQIWTSWRSRGGTVVRVASRSLEGERLDVYRLRPPRHRVPTSPVRRTKARRPGTGVRHRHRPGRPSA